MSTSPPPGVDLEETDTKADQPTRHRKRWADVPFGNRWRSRFLHLPRHIPRPLLHVLSQEGPYPYVVDIPSRFSNHTIAVWIYVPPRLPSPTPGDDDIHQDLHAGNLLQREVPVHIDFHGGGFIMGGPLEQAAFCARVSRSRHCLVLCVDYCTGPLHEYAAAFEDAEDITCAVLDTKGRTEAGRTLYQAIYHGRPTDHRSHRRMSDTIPHEGLVVDPKSISFSGFSSGATIALNLTLSTITNSPEEPSSEPRNGDTRKDSAFYQDRSADRLDREHWPSPIPKKAPVFPVFLFYPQLEQGNSGHDKDLPSGVPIVRPPKFGKSLADRLTPVYLPERLRSHSRASPSLASPSAIHDKARFFVVLPKEDSLNHHAYEWVKTMREAGWSEDRLRVFDAPRSNSGFAHIPERIMDRFSVQMKKSTYNAMMGFWSQIETTEEILSAMRAP